MFKGLFNVIAQILKGEYLSSNVDNEKHIVVINRDLQESLEIEGKKEEIPDEIQVEISNEISDEIEENIETGKTEETGEIEKISEKVVIEENSTDKYGQEGKVKKRKYIYFEEFLQKEEKEEYILTYKEIEKIIGDILPKTAYNRSSWMGNNDAYPLPKIWMKYGYESTDVKLGETVTLKKIIKNNKK